MAAGCCDWETITEINLVSDCSAQSSVTKLKAFIVQKGRIYGKDLKQQPVALDFYLYLLSYFYDQGLMLKHLTNGASYEFSISPFLAGKILLIAII